MSQETMSLELPEVLPVFPLSGVLLLPSGRLPLNVFELRYRNMVEDALASQRCLGIIQPLDSADMFVEDLPRGSGDRPPLYDVGCVGNLERCDTLPDGRYLILLQGIQRFRVEREVSLHRGYRRVEAKYEEFAVDERIEESEIPAAPLMEALADFGQEHSITFEFDKLSELPGLALLNSVAMVLPFPPAEKQALLEAETVEQRYETLITLMNMGIELRSDNPNQGGLN